MPKDIGLEILAGVALAAFITSYDPIGGLISEYLTNGYAFVFAIGFGLVSYMCSTASVPLVHAFIQEGMNAGAGLTLLILGPIVSYGTIFVIRKEFGLKPLLIFIASTVIFSTLLGLSWSQVSS